ncbi:MAG TPA: sensor histidine kinase [Verrucomicrobiae bacterium]|nr:sensor histidine kinase [Verrucomicrobiae bacterium]
MPEPDFRLRIDAHALVQLGEQLITDDEQALLELVKNSYDADADWARIKIDCDYVPDPEKDHAPREARGLIEIEDNGVGMDQKAIERGWLLISLSLKREQKVQGKRTKKHKRLPLGDKGLGRLGTMKLGKCLSVETRHSTTEHGWLVTFQWSDIKSGVLLEDVPIKWIRIPPDGSTGTKVRIFGLRELESWRTPKRRSRLETKLSGLISPFDGTVNNFAVSLKLNGRDIDLLQIPARLRETATMTFDYDWDGKRLNITGRLKLIWFRKKKREGYDHFISRDNGQALFHVLQENKDLGKEFQLERSDQQGWFLKLSKQIGATDVQFAELEGTDPGTFSGSLDYFDLDTDIQLPKQFLGNAKDYRDQVKDLAQVYVYRDGFGVRMGQDWLRLGGAWTSESGYYSLKPSNVIGFFRISVEHNPLLIEKSDREGFTDNSAWRGFSALTTIITSSLNKALNRMGRSSSKFINEASGSHATDEESETNYGNLLGQLESLLGASESIGDRFEKHARGRLYGLRAVEGAARLMYNDLKETDERRQKGKKLLETVETLQKELASDDEEIAKLTKELKAQKQLAAIIRKRIDDFDERSQLLYEMVGVGLSAQALAHDVPAMLHQLEDHAKSLHKLCKTRPPDIEKIISGADEIKTSVGAVEQMIDFVRPMLRGRRLSRRRAKISEFAQSFFELRGARLLSRGIRWHLETEQMFDFEILFNPGRFTQVLDNLTTNSEYWIEHFYGAKSGKGKIFLEIRDPELVFYDNGQGIRPDLEESIFGLFVSGKEAEEGSGLGLFITRQLLQRDNCTISLDTKRNEHGRLYRFIINFSGAKR